MPPSVCVRLGVGDDRIAVQCFILSNTSSPGSLAFHRAAHLWPSCVSMASPCVRSCRASHTEVCAARPDQSSSALGDASRVCRPDSRQAPPTGFFKDRPSVVFRCGVLSHALSPARFGDAVPTASLGPSSWFLTTSTGSSTSSSAGLLHPASDHGVHRVSAQPVCPRPCLLADAHALQSVPLTSSGAVRRRRPVPPRHSPGASWCGLEAFFRLPIRCVHRPLPTRTHPWLSWASLLEPHTRCLLPRAGLRRHAFVSRCTEVHPPWSPAEAVFQCLTKR
jgi:hypothetical protein